MLKNLDRTRLRRLHARVVDYRNRRLVAPFGVTNEPFEIQMVLSALDDGHVAHLRSGLQATKKAFIGRTRWQALIRASELALGFWEEFEECHGSGCLVNVDKWLNCSPAWLIGHETIFNAHRLISQYGEEYREKAVTFSLWVRPTTEASKPVVTDS